jgi:hypothetical protein
MGGVSGMLSKFSFEPEKIQGRVWWIVLVVWVLVVLCAICSIYANSSPLTPRQRRFWTLAVILLPGLGLLAYIPFSRKKEGFDFMKKPKTEKRSAPSSVEQK